MIYCVALAFDSRRENAPRTSKKKLHEIRVVNVQVEQRTAGLIGMGVSATAPGRRFRYAPKIGREHLAIGFRFDNQLEPSPAWPKSHAHCGHKKSTGRLRLCG